MRPLWPLAVITFKEGVRSRAIQGICFLALLFLSANFIVSGMIAHDVGKVAVDLSLSTVSFTALLLVLTVGINLVAKDLDRKTIYMALAMPISRSQYIVGKFLGVAMLVVFSTILLGIFALASIYLVKIGYPDSFSRFSLSLILLAVAFITLMLILIAAVSFLFASFASTSFLSLVLTIIVYLIGRSIGDVKALVESPQALQIQVSPTTVKVVQAAYYFFPNLALFDIKTQAAHALPVSPSYILWTACYGVFYTALAITLATLIFRKREFP